MSKFSGKYDLFDSLFSQSKSQKDIDWSKISIYQIHQDSKIKLNIQSYKDALPYAAFPELSFSRDNDENITIVIGDVSCVDIKNKEQLLKELKLIKREYFRCKRKKTSFIPTKVAKEVCLTNCSNNALIELCNRIQEHPYSKVEKLIDGLVLDNAIYYKKILYNEMLEVDYPQNIAQAWCFKNTRLW